MNQSVLPRENSSERLPRTAEETSRVADALIALLRSIPETWATFDPDAQAAVQANALFHLTAAGLVERRNKIRLTMANSPTAVEMRYEATGEGGFAEVMEHALPKLFDQWLAQWQAWLESPAGMRSPFHAEEVPPPEWRLSDQGVIARDGLKNAAGLNYAVEFVLKQGFFGPGFWVRKFMIGRTPTIDDQQTIAAQLAAAGTENVDLSQLPRPPVPGAGRLLEVRKVPTEPHVPPSPLQVNVANWSSGADELVAALKAAFGTALSGAQPTTPITPRGDDRNATSSEPDGNTSGKQIRRPSKLHSDAKHPKPPELSTHEWMMRLLDKHPESHGWSIREWEIAIGVTKSTISGTDAWKGLLAAQNGVRFAEARKRRRPNATGD